VGNVIRRSVWSRRKRRPKATQGQCGDEKGTEYFQAISLPARLAQRPKPMSWEGKGGSYGSANKNEEIETDATDRTKDHDQSAKDVGA
jgi:hypothetical protein